jgi:hypothetical protein
MESPVLDIDIYLNYLTDLPLSNVYIQLNELLQNAVQEEKHIELCSWINCIRFFTNYDLTDNETIIYVTHNNTVMIKIPLDEGIVSIECLEDILYIQFKEDRWYIMVKDK